MGEVGGDPFVSEDQLEAYYVQYLVYPYVISRASRSTTSNPFMIDIAPASFNLASVENADPSMTLDGTMLVFVSGASGQRKAYQTTRLPGGSWADPELVPGLTEQTLESVSISWDGLTLYFTRYDRVMFRAVRPSRTAAFDTGQEVADAIQWPTVAADELELFAHGLNGGIDQYTRDSTSQRFGNRIQAGMYGADPQLSHSGTRLWITYSAAIGYVDRVCP
jgi:hypothetical protein